MAAGAEAAALACEIQQKLAALVDPINGQPAVKRVYRAAEVYRGPYTEAAPDLIVGYAAVTAPRGRRPSARLRRTCSTPTPRPGVATIASITRWCRASCSATGAIEAENPRLMDIGPTVLDLFGVEVPGYMDGKALGVRIRIMRSRNKHSAVPAWSRSRSLELFGIKVPGYMDGKGLGVDESE